MICTSMDSRIRLELLRIGRRKCSTRNVEYPSLENTMANEKGPNIKKKQTCKNCEGTGLLKKGDKVVKCQRCKGTGVR